MINVAHDTDYPNAVCMDFASVGCMFDNVPAVAVYRLFKQSWKSNELFHSPRIPLGNIRCIIMGLKALERYNRSLKGRFRQLKSKAKTRKIDFDLTIEQYCSVVDQKQCVYCQNVLPPTGYGLDRIDSSKGYSIDNILPCCGICNRIKNDSLTMKEMILAARVIRLVRAHFKPR